MVTLPVLQQGCDAPLCLASDKLPQFYMNDYSVLGLLVNSLDGAYQVLADKDIAVRRKAEHLELDIDRADRLAGIVDLLKRSGIACGMADIVDQVYQG